MESHALDSLSPTMLARMMIDLHKTVDFNQTIGPSRAEQLSTVDFKPHLLLGLSDTGVTVLADVEALPVALENDRPAGPDNPSHDHRSKKMSVFGVLYGV